MSKIPNLKHHKFYSRYIGILSSNFDSDCDFTGNLYDKCSIKIENTSG